jgi:hypothetical protein
VIVVNESSLESAISNDHFRMLVEELKDEKYAGRGIMSVYVGLFHTQAADGFIVAREVFSRKNCYKLAKAAGVNPILPSDPDYPITLVPERMFAEAWVRAGRPKPQRVWSVPKNRALASCINCAKVADVMQFHVPSDPDSPQGAELWPAEWCRYCGAICVFTKDGVSINSPNAYTAMAITEPREHQVKAIEAVFDSILDEG